jgi:hypothetical protein
MKRILLTTVAASALIGCTTLAMAQTGSSVSSPTEGQPSTSKGLTPQSPNKASPGGTMSNPQHGAQTPTTNHSAQNPGTSTSGREGQNQIQGQTQGQNSERLGQDQDRDRTGREHNDRDRDRLGQRNNDTEHGVQTETGKSGTNMNAAEEHREGGKTGKSVQLSVTQRTRIQHVVTEGHVARIEHPNFSISVGTRIPRTVHLATLPPDIVEVVPEYRGYDFAVVGDNILIIDPVTLEIVDVIPV